MNALERLHKRSIKVTDFAAQYWCEKQMELRYLYGEKTSENAKKGGLIHELLEKEVNVPIMLEPRTYADYVYKILYTDYISLDNLKQKHKTRELNVFGIANHFNIVGKIDELDIKDGKVLVVEDKTKAKDELPNESQLMSHKIQIMFYRRILDDLRSGTYTMEDFRKAYGSERLFVSAEFARQLDAIDVPRDMHSINAIMKKAFDSFKNLNSISDSIYIRYRNQFSGKTIKLYKFSYDNNDLENAESYLFKYWNGERSASPVPEQEKWKCNYCVFFGNHCKVWWQKKGLENES